MTILKNGLFVISTAFLSSIAGAETKICIHTYYTSGLKGFSSALSGHASISIQTDGQTTTKWGYYPDGLKFNYMTDGELSPDLVKWYEDYYKKEDPTTNPKVLQNKHCKKISPADVERAASLVDGYEGRFGQWTSLTNNCVGFAKYIYTQVTKDKIPLLPQQPSMLYTLIEKAQEQKQEDFAHVKPIDGPSPSVVH